MSIENNNLPELVQSHNVGVHLEIVRTPESDSLIRRIGEAAVEMAKAAFSWKDSF